MSEEDEKEKNSNPWWKRTAYTAIIFAVGGWGFDYLQEEFDAYRAEEDKKWSEVHKKLNEIKVENSISHQQQEAIWQATSDNNKKLEDFNADQRYLNYVTAYQQRLIERTADHKCEGKHDEVDKEPDVVKTPKDVKNLSTLQKMMKKLSGSDEEKKIIQEVEETEIIQNKIKELAEKPKEKIDDSKKTEQMKREYIKQHQQKIHQEALKNLKEIEKK